jgi:hypothetical protein
MQNRGGGVQCRVPSDGRFLALKSLQMVRLCLPVDDTYKTQYGQTDVKIRLRVSSMRLSVPGCKRANYESNK